MKQKIELKNKTILVTGSAGFIGASLVIRLCEELDAATIVSLDNMNGYYDPALKEYRLKMIETVVKDKSKIDHIFIKADIANQKAVTKVFEEYKPDVVVNLAAQAGVRCGNINPTAYLDSNLIGFFYILEACRNNSVEHLVYASSSSVYGGNKKLPFNVEDKTDTPISLYAATKKSNELLAHSYSKLYNIPATGLRFFTVYGPMGRPDMAYFNFTNKFLNGKTVRLFNYGNCKRDFTYVDDIIEGILRVMQYAPQKMNDENGLPIPPYSIYNIGRGRPYKLIDFVTILAEELVKAKVLPVNFNLYDYIEMVAMQPGDVPVTYADCETLQTDYGFTPKVTLRRGLRCFVDWYKRYYEIN